MMWPGLNKEDFQDMTDSIDLAILEEPCIQAENYKKEQRIKKQEARRLANQERKKESAKTGED